MKTLNCAFCGVVNPPGRTVCEGCGTGLVADSNLTTYAESPGQFDAIAAEIEALRS
jgi:hypothetical protein